jgi:hypothetical protein
VRKIATLMNVTRVYNANAAAAGMRRAFALARDFARERRAFGRALIEHALHRESLAAIAVEAAAALVLLFRTAELQGREEQGEADADERALLRLLTPLVKLETGRQAVAVASEALECFGGAGYVEDTGLPRLLRDAQVLTIWEGTTNVLALDALRAVDREDALRALRADAERLLAPLPAGVAAGVRAALQAAAAAAAERDEERRTAGARAAARGLARSYAGALLLDQARWSEEARDPAAPLWGAASARWSRGLAATATLVAVGPDSARLLALEESDAVAPVPPRA